MDSGVFGDVIHVNMLYMIIVIIYNVCNIIYIFQRHILYNRSIEPVK